MSSPGTPAMPDGYTGPFKGLTDEQVLARAQQALGKVNSYPLGSVQRAMQWAVYTEAKTELDLRLWGFMTRRLRERNEG
jgi:hypothetical protein